MSLLQEELESLEVPHLPAEFDDAYLGLVDVWVPIQGGVTQATLASYDRSKVLLKRIDMHLTHTGESLDADEMAELYEEFDEVLASEQNGYIGGDRQILYISRPHPLL